ncbi:MAG: hypothetical protein ACOCQI_01740 [Desulfosalsimonas sp.]
MAGNNQQGDQAAQASSDPRSDQDIMTGYDQFEIYRGDFFSGLDADHSEEPSGAPGQEAAPSNEGGTTGQQGRQEQRAPESEAGTGEQPVETGESGQQEGGEPQGESGKYRHKSLEEAERSYSNLLSRTTRAEQENARMREELEKMRAARQQEEKNQREEEVRRQRDEFINSKYEEATKAVDELDPDDPEYHNKVARIWADAHRSIDAFEPDVSSEPPPASEAVRAYASGGQGDRAAAGLESPSQAGDQGEAGPEPSPSGLAEPAGGEAQAEPAGGEAQAEPAGGEAQAEQGPSPEEIQQMIDARILEQSPGFDREDPAFIGFCGKVPSEDEQGNPLTIEQQIDRAIDMTRQHYDRKRRELLQENVQPMDRTGPGAGGSAGSSQSSPQQNETFGDIVEAAVSSRQL